MARGKATADWFRRAKDSEEELRQTQEMQKRVAAAVNGALADARRDAWWRLVEANGWKGGQPMASVVPPEDRRRFARFWNAMGAPPHATEG